MPSRKSEPRVTSQPMKSLEFKFNLEKLVEENQQLLDHPSIGNLPSFISDMQQDLRTNILISKIYKNFAVLANDQLPILDVIEYFYQKLNIDILDHPENHDIRNKLEDYLLTSNYCRVRLPDIIDSLINHFILQPLEKTVIHEPERVRELFELVFTDNKTLLNFIVEKSSPKQLEKTFEIAYKAFSSSNKNEHLTPSNNKPEDEFTPTTDLPRFYVGLLHSTTSNGNILCSTIRSAKTQNLIIILDILSKISNVFGIISFFRNDDLSKCPLYMISKLPETTNNNHIRSIFANFLKRHFVFPKHLNTDKSIIEYARENYSLLQKSDLTYTPPNKQIFTYTKCFRASKFPTYAPPSYEATQAQRSTSNSVCPVTQIVNQPIYDVTSVGMHPAPPSYEATQAQRFNSDSVYPVTPIVNQPIYDVTSVGMHPVPPSYEATQAQRFNSDSVYPFTPIVNYPPYDVTLVGMHPVPPSYDSANFYSFNHSPYNVTSVGMRHAPPSYQDTFPNLAHSSRLRTALLPQKHEEMPDLQATPTSAKFSNFNINAAPYRPKCLIGREDSNLQPSSDSNPGSLPLTSDTHASSIPSFHQSRNIARKAVTKAVPPLRALETNGRTFKPPLPRSFQVAGQHVKALQESRSAKSINDVKR